MSYIYNRIIEIQKLVNLTESFPVNQLENLVSEIEKCWRRGGKIAFVGHGGSAAEAMHIAAEFTGKCIREHEPWSAICLNESQSALTAIANDYGVEYMFSRMVSAHMREEDILIALSTSGKSRNILKALETANNMNVKVYLWMGAFEAPNIKANFLKVPSKSTPQIQEIHLMWGHLIAEILEEKLI